MVDDVLWGRLQSPDPEERASVVGPLLRAFMGEGSCSLEESQRITEGLAGLLEDPDPLPRRCLANGVAAESCIPHAWAFALAHDQPDIATPVILSSPLLRDYDLMELSLGEDETRRRLVASRPQLSAAVSSLLIRKGDSVTCINLLRNPGAVITERALEEIAYRYDNDLSVLAVMLERPGLPASIRCKLMLASCSVLIADADAAQSSGGLGQCGRLSRCWESVVLEVVSAVSEEDNLVFIAHLEANGRLTTGLLMRALISGNLFFFSAALAHLSRLPVNRCRELLERGNRSGFFAIYECAGLPLTTYEDIFFILHEVYKRVGAGEDLSRSPVRRRLIQSLLSSYVPQDSARSDEVLEFLLCLYDESMHDEARVMTLGGAVGRAA